MLVSRQAAAGQSVFVLRRPALLVLRSLSTAARHFTARFALHRTQEMRERGVPVPSDAPGPVPLSGSHDDGSGTTTNLFIAYLSPEVTENVLMREFGRFGALASIKIMWPKDDEQRRRGYNSGFVAFMERADAARALDALNGVRLCGREMSIGWGKAMPIPARPIWVPVAPGDTASAAGFDPAAGPGRQHRAADAAAAAGLAAAAPATSADIPDVVVRAPEDGRQRFVIDSLACHVLQGGSALERRVAEAERDNPEFAFLRDRESSDAAYYRWRVYSLACGDSLHSWRLEPFAIVRGGRSWLPPPMAVAPAPKAADAERQQEALPAAQNERLAHILEHLDASRAKIEEAMVFAIDNSEHGVSWLSGWVSMQKVEPYNKRNSGGNSSCARRDVYARPGLRAQVPQRCRLWWFIPQRFGTAGSAVA